MTSSEFRSFLVAIFKLPLARVVPLQGNWWNPQDGNLAENWIGFKLESANPRIKPFYREDEDGAVSSAHCEVPVRLQIVGKQAEVMAQSIINWPNRMDVLDALEALGAQPILEGFGKYTVTDFFQEGGNTVWAYNVTFRLIEEIQAETTQVQILTSEMGGSLNG
jgi:hypothetical protein